MHLTFEGRQDADKSGSRDRPSGRSPAKKALGRPGWSTPPVFRRVRRAVVRRRKTDALPPATRLACRRLDWSVPVELSSSEDGACGPGAPASRRPPVRRGWRTAYDLARRRLMSGRSRRHAVSVVVGSAAAAAASATDDAM